VLSNLPELHTLAAIIIMGLLLCALEKGYCATHV
jgi:hypothetical protein